MAELARLLEAGRLPAAVPARVREAVRARVDALGEHAAGVLEVGAVAGRFSISGLAAAGGHDRAHVAAALEPALAAGLLVNEEPGRYAFAHAIVRDAVYDDLAPARRAQLHEAVARALKDRRDAGADVEAAELAHHALAAARGGGDPQPAWEAAVEAAREADAALGHAEAAGRYADALEALGLGAEAPAQERLDVLLALAEATYAAGDIEAGRSRFAKAAAVGPAQRRAGDARPRRDRVRPPAAVRRPWTPRRSSCSETRCRRSRTRPASCARGSPASSPSACVPPPTRSAARR